MTSAKRFIVLPSSLRIVVIARKMHSLLMQTYWLKLKRMLARVAEKVPFLSVSATKTSFIYSGHYFPLSSGVRTMNKFSFSTTLVAILMARFSYRGCILAAATSHFFAWRKGYLWPVTTLLSLSFFLFLALWPLPFGTSQNSSSLTAVTSVN